MQFHIVIAIAVICSMDIIYNVLLFYNNQMTLHSKLNNNNSNISSHAIARSVV